MQLQLHDLSGRHPAASAHAPAALRGLRLALAAGEQVAVIGPSGAGKTTLLHLLACALRPSAGHLLIAGADPWSLRRSALRQLRGQLFLAPQVPPLPPRQRVVTAVLAGRLPQMGLWASLRSLFYPRDIALADAALEHFDLAEKLFDRVDRLSGGERQRVGLARAIAALGSPAHPAGARLLLVDEPLSALDPSRADQAMRSLTQAAHASGATLVCTLHHVSMALEHFPRIIGLRDGELAFDLPPEQVTPERLQQLYAQHEDELHSTAPPATEPSTASPQPVVMHCR
ncbi:phosphonate ABC transporter ATP-binding protein [Hydrogenophaga sp.]|uniref:phosphonate ABC transporter ATP-binding protein n=1 Tax=Hydrogenophaga sp. TaxID=1904254 RepID=UPI00356429F2